MRRDFVCGFSEMIDRSEDSKRDHLSLTKTTSPALFNSEVSAVMVKSCLLPSNKADGEKSRDPHDPRAHDYLLSATHCVTNFNYSPSFSSQVGRLRSKGEVLEKLPTIRKISNLK